MDYPELAARTGRFTYGAPRAIEVSADGARVTFLRSGGPEDPVDRLWVFDVASGTERLIADPAGLLATPARVVREPGGTAAGGAAPDASGHAGIDAGTDADTGADGERASGSAALPGQEAALRERLRLTAAGIGSYALDPDGRVAVFPLAGRLFHADLATGRVTELATAGPAVDPRPDPTGERVAYVTGGALHVVDLAGADMTLASEQGITWGLAEFIAAEEFYRYRGYWWAPDGRSILAARVDEARVPVRYLHDPAEPGAQPRSMAYPHAGATNAEVTLHLLDLDGGWVDVHWDREAYPYLACVSWTGANPPLLTVLRRLQQHALVLAVDPRTGETQVHAELADQRWVEPVPGTPRHLPDGRVVVGGDIMHGGYDTRCLLADGALLTSPALYVRRACGLLTATDARAGASDLVVEASAGEPGEQHLFEVPTHAGGPVDQARRLTSGAGWHRGAVGGGTLAIGWASLDHAGTAWTVWHDGRRVGEISSATAVPPYAPRPVLDRVTDRRLPAGVLYPRAHVAGRKLPVLVDVYGGPGHQEVIAARSAWLGRQWWADQGFAVVVIDNRGTPGVAPSFEKAIHHRMADVVLGDQVDALHALAAKHPDLDLGRVAIRGWSFGGWLAALAVLRRPDMYRVGVAGAPVTDWALYDTAYTERYLGLPADNPDGYAHHNLVELAAEPVGERDSPSPLLLVHGLVDDNVAAANTLRLSEAMLRAGRPHFVIPLPGATHMAAGGLSERLLRLERDFIRDALR